MPAEAVKRGVHDQNVVDLAAKLAMLCKVCGIPDTAALGRRLHGGKASAEYAYVARRIVRRWEKKNPPSINHELRDALALFFRKEYGIEIEGQSFMRSNEGFEAILDEWKKERSTGKLPSTPGEPPPTPIAEKIFRNWQNSPKRGDVHIVSGIYQMYRHNKPLPADRGGSRKDYDDPKDHAVICELIYVVANAMECVLVTSQRDVYFGCLYINEENTLYGLLQRPSSSGLGVHQRFIMTRLEGRNSKALFSGLLLRSGDLTRMPIGAECLFVYVPPTTDPDLERAFAEVYNRGWTRQPIDLPSPILDYVTDSPGVDGADPNRMLHVRDVPFLEKAVSEFHDGMDVFREPSRSLDKSQIASLKKHLKMDLEIFRHSTRTRG